MKSQSLAFLLLASGCVAWGEVYTPGETCTADLAECMQEALQMSCSWQSDRVVRGVNSGCLAKLERCKGGLFQCKEQDRMNKLATRNCVLPGAATRLFNDLSRLVPKEETLLSQLATCDSERLKLWHANSSCETKLFRLKADNRALSLAETRLVSQVRGKKEVEERLERCKISGGISMGRVRELEKSLQAAEKRAEEPCPTAPIVRVPKVELAPNCSVCEFKRAQTEVYLNISRDATMGLEKGRREATSDRDICLSGKKVCESDKKAAEGKVSLLLKLNRDLTSAQNARDLALGQVAALKRQVADLIQREGEIRASGKADANSCQEDRAKVESDLGGCNSVLSEKSLDLGLAKNKLESCWRDVRREETLLRAQLVNLADACENGTVTGAEILARVESTVITPSGVLECVSTHWPYMVALLVSQLIVYVLVMLTKTVCRYKKKVRKVQSKLSTSFEMVGTLTRAQNQNGDVHANQAAGQAVGQAAVAAAGV